MILLANILRGIAFILDMLLNMTIILVIARAVISWVNPDPFNAIVRFLTASTEPLLVPLRRHIPPVGPGIDLTPMILLLLLYFVQVAFVGTLNDYALRMRQSAIFAEPARSELSIPASPRRG